MNTMISSKEAIEILQEFIKNAKEDESKNVTFKSRFDSEPSVTLSNLNPNKIKEVHVDPKDNNYIITLKQKRKSRDEREVEFKVDKKSRKIDIHKIGA